MKRKDIENILGKFNQQKFRELLEPTTGEQVQINGNASQKVQPDTFLPCVPGKCFCGLTSKSYKSSTDYLDTCLVLQTPDNRDSGLVAAGAVIDSNSSDADLPVVLVVGINYGQGSSYLNSSIPISDDTKMRDRLGRVIGHLKDNGCPPGHMDDDTEFHLVAANFFPWITSQSWSSFDFNSIEESALIRCWGYKCPIAYIESLFDEFEGAKNLEAIVFHGANNATSYLGNCLISRLRDTGKLDNNLEIIFCDNLAPGFSPRISNGIKLNCNIGRSSLACTDYDE
ncbi:MAG: hypothetical protein KF712_09600 [Akkermansiaceae bacterium]|nr:hypothetical protein [Akkermansiaceae bacterium]